MVLAWCLQACLKASTWHLCAEEQAHSDAGGSSACTHGCTSPARGLLAGVSTLLALVLGLQITCTLEKLACKLLSFSHEVAHTI